MAFTHQLNIFLHRSKPDTKSTPDTTRHAACSNGPHPVCTKYKIIMGSNVFLMSFAMLRRVGRARVDTVE